MKYIMFVNEAGFTTPLIFPNHIPHKNMTGDVPLIIGHFSNQYGNPKIGKPVSAGFVRITPEGEVECYGRSESLGLSAQPYDHEPISKSFQRSEHDDGGWRDS